MFYNVLVDLSLEELGISPGAIAAHYRQGAQAVGELRGSSPEETALFIVSQLPVVHLLELDAVQIRVWIGQRKLDPNDPKMRDALLRLGWQALAHFASMEEASISA